MGRAVAGLGSAGIFSGALIIVAYSVPLSKRPMYSGFIGAMYGIASVAGPLLGGVFTDKGKSSSSPIPDPGRPPKLGNILRSGSMETVYLFDLS